MLISIREKTQGVVAGFIVVVIILVFALWGVNSYFAGDSEVIVAKGSDLKISQRVYRNAYRNTVERQRGRVPQTMLDSPFYKQQIVERLIQDALLTQYVESAGFRISDKDLNEKIRQQAYFQKNNSFDGELYKLALRSQQLSPAQYERQVRGDLMSIQLSSGYTANSFVTEKEVNQLLVLMRQERDIDYVEIKPDMFKKNIVVSNKKIQEFYDKNKNNYQTEEKIKIEYVILSAKDLAKDYKPTTAELKEAFESGSGFVTPAKRWVSHILLEVPKGANKKEAAAVLKKIEKLAREIKGGKRFATVAKANSDDKGSAVKGGDLGEMKTGVMVKEFEAVVNGMMKTGAISKPVRTQYGYHLIKLTKYNAEKRASFSTVKSKLEKMVRKQVGEKKFFDASPDFYNVVYEQPDSLQPAADSLGLIIKKSAWFTRTGGIGIAAKKKIVAASFHPDVIEAGRNSEAIEIDETTLVAVRLLKHKTREQKPITDVKASIKNILRDRLALEKVKELKARVLAELKKKNDLKAVARKFNLKLLTSKKIIRNKTQTVDKRIIDRVFTVSLPGKKANGVGEADLGAQGVAIFSLKAIRPGNVSKADEKMTSQARELLRERHGEGYFQAFLGNLRKESKIKIYKENL
jgi:peptidyl-prolyl cis-trans isomerase D